MTRPRTVLVLTPGIRGYYFASVLKGMQAELAADGGRLLVVQTVQSGHDDGVNPSDFDLPVGWQHTSALVSVLNAADSPHLNRAATAGMPVVTISGRFPDLAASLALPDNRGGTRAAVQHLVEHGHTEIGFVGNLRHHDMAERYSAFCDSLAEHGLAGSPPIEIDTELHRWRGGEEAALEFLRRSPRPTALVVANDHFAIGLMNALDEAGVRVPDDLAVVGFDDIPEAVFCEPPLTTVRQRFADVGRQAARLAVAGGEPRVQEVPVQLTLRRSCGCPAAATRPDQPAAELAGTVRSMLASARDIMGQAQTIQSALEEQARVNRGLDAVRHDSGSLDWLRQTHVPFGVFARWTGEPPDGELTVVGVHDQAGQLPDLIGSQFAVTEFPPAPLLDATASAGRVPFVIPVTHSGRPVGLLALAGTLDTGSSLEIYRHWGFKLGAALVERELEDAVRVSERRYTLAARATNDGLWEFDRNSGTVFFSERCAQLLGLTDCPAEERLARWLERVHPDDLEAVREAMTGPFEADEVVNAEYRLKRDDGSYHWVLSRALAVQSVDGAEDRLVGSLSDIQERRDLEEQLRTSTLHDPLTELPNRRLFVSRLEQALRLARRHGTPFAVLFIDLDGFKSINDSLGHGTGDRLLQTVAQRLAATMRGIDTVARFGGDEFAALLHGTGRDAAQFVAERLQRILDEPIRVDDHEFVISGSMGVATSDTEYVSAEDVLRDADTAMYHAKAADRGSIAFFDATMHAQALRQLRLTGELRRGLEMRQFEVHYQPVVDLLTGQANRFEALVRWRHPERGLLVPGEFLPLLIETGLIVRLHEWLVEDVCRQLAEWGPAVASVAVNLSDREFWNPELLPHLRGCLERHGVAADQVRLEITEDVVMHRPEAALRLMRSMHDAGFELHIDDFGTGYSSLDSLHRFPVDALKIDRSFVAGIGHGAQSEELVRAILAMGSALGLEVIAEGVETVEQMDFLRLAGCTAAQGYRFSRPLAAGDVLAWLARSASVLRVSA